jgi:hypothetical protein
MGIMISRLVAPFVASSLLMAGGAAADKGQYKFRLHPTQGCGLLEWVSPSTFRFCRGWTENGCAAGGATIESDFNVSQRDAGSHLEFRSSYVSVQVSKESLRLRVTTTGGAVLLDELTEVTSSGGEMSVERAASVGERFYGLGPRSEPGLDLHGRIISATVPFLISSRGYGIYDDSKGSLVLDLAHSKPDRYRVSVRGAEEFAYYMYYGPDPKQIFEEHSGVAERPKSFSNGSFGILERAQLPRMATALPQAPGPTAESLCDSVHSLVNASMSAILVPGFDLAPYLSTAGPQFGKALQIANVVPVLFVSGHMPLEATTQNAIAFTAKFRTSLTPFLLTYAEEARTQGIPMIHPLPMQFPRDPEAAKVDDAFMLGDEILAAPVCGPGDRRTVYLPMGFWTDLRTNRVYSGRQHIEIEAAGKETPLLIKNGSIVPIAPETEAEPMILHYMPKLAAEFFLMEPDRNDYSQFHASPAGDLMRLEIESKKDRVYEWVVHHMESASRVTSGGIVFERVGDPKVLKPGCWYFDAGRKNLHVRIQVTGEASHVIYVAG